MSLASCRWIGDVSSVQALSKIAVSMRKDEASLELKAVHIPDHLDILATHPSGANIHFLFTNVLGDSKGKVITRPLLKIT